MATKTSARTDTTSRSERSEDRTGHTDQSGRGWHGDPEGHAEAGRKGGQAVSADKSHMATIGRKGGEAVSRNRNHMAEIGRKGGQARGDGSASTTERRRRSNS